MTTSEHFKRLGSVGWAAFVCCPCGLNQSSPTIGPKEKTETGYVLTILRWYLSLLFLISGCTTKPNSSQPQIAVSNSYLNAAVADLCGSDQNTMSLVPPGMCPGHFDIKPSQVQQLCDCKILLLFDFQQNIENAVPRIKDKGLIVSSITAAQGMCLPDTYMDVVRQVADALSQIYPDKKAEYDLRLESIAQRLDSLKTQSQSRVKDAGLTNVTVVTSAHQEIFAKWLGLNPISTFAGRDTATPAQINENIAAAKLTPVKFVIANQQAGTQMAAALAEHLGVYLVVFSNFPTDNNLTAPIPAFDRLVHSNIDSLLEVSIR